MAGRNVVRTTVVLSLGEGRSIGVFTDAWIPGHYETRLEDHPVTEVQVKTRIGDWIDTNTKTWNEEVIRTVVLDDEANKMLNVPIPLISRADELRWPFERGGKVT